MPRIAPLLVCSILCLALAACGAGGESGPVETVDKGETSPLTISTLTLPAASAGEPFPPTQLKAVNAQGNVVWTVESGTLPVGVALNADGMLTGTPAATGYFPFVVNAKDGVTSDSQDLGIAVDTVGLVVSGGLVGGEAWTTRALSIAAAGQTGTVSFGVVATGSGGTLSNENPTAGTATWTTGATGGPGVTDTLRVTDSSTGDIFDLSFEVMPDPAETHTAAFGSTDVWWIDPTSKVGNHPYATDLQAALVDVGMRDPTNFDPAGSQADQLAELYFRVELLRRVNPMFLRNADGTAGAQGLPISFPFEEPGSGYTKPSAADYLPGSPVRYSQMALLDGRTSGVIGTAFVDSTTNALHENDTTLASFELGVFTNQIAYVFNLTYTNPLKGSPLNAGDVEALRALLYQLPDPGGRYATIKSVAEGFALTFAAVVAHEIGHSVGLGHTSPPVTGSLMNASAAIHPSATYFFTAEAVGQLNGALPGLGRTTGSQTAASRGPVRRAPVPGGGIQVCNCRHEPVRR